LHIPFCKQACAYCNFHFTTSLRYKDDMVEALKKEILLEKHFFKGQKVETIYFGGGTPSLLTLQDCHSLIELLRSEFLIDESAEITLEANPDDIDPGKIKGWKNAGINRLSIGVQSFYEEELKWMNRAHNANEAIQCIEWCMESGMNNISIDLIYGSPLLDDVMWQKNVETAIRYNIPHLSCYALTVEEKTPLFKSIAAHVSKNVENEKQARQFLLLMQWLKESGYEHYEVSNFSKPGMQSRHNSSYWKGSHYLGLGPSAHSYDGKNRRWNVANNNVYIRAVNDGNPQRETETLTTRDQINEMIMISLRTKAGLDLVQFEKMFGGDALKKLQAGMEKFIFQGLLFVERKKAILTEEGMLAADGIAASLFF
jgi:oxygen-independent coproporphyrinogen III oxidase